MDTIIQTKEVDEVSFVTSYISCIEPQLQRSVAIVRPDAMVYEDVILRAVNEVGFSIIQVSVKIITSKFLEIIHK